MMRLAILTMMVSGGLAFAVQAAPTHDGPQQACIAAGILRAAATSAGPAGMRCSQYLSTTMVVRPAPDKRT
jgi:hypothetical protein